MCGRFTLFADPDLLAELFGLASAPELAPRFNIAPTQPVGIVRVNPFTHLREWALTHWGLIPSWSKDPTIGARMINARAETADEKPSFRAAFKRRRCLIPASGFYEWRQGEKGKQPYFIGPAGSATEVLAFGGLWETWVSPDGSELDSCTILTTEPNELMAELHNRMPLILAPEDFGEWLGAGVEDSPRQLQAIHHLLRPYAVEKMRAYPVGTYVNNARNEGRQCVEPLAER